jgi:hypothetical protein
MNIDLTQIVQAVIALLAAIITYRVIPWIKANTTEKQQRAVETAARIGVMAMEQIYGDGHGEEKFEAVASYLRGKGLAVDTKAIEAAVYSEINRFKELPAPEEVTEE